MLLYRHRHVGFNLFEGLRKTHADFYKIKVAEMRS